jgi:phosphoesterase RecJ-like protein
MMVLNEIIEALKNSNEIIILPHISADGDALGSCLALGLALRTMNKHVSVYTEEKIPYIYDFLPGANLAEVYKGGKIQADIVLALDTGDLGRLGKRIDIFNSARVTVNIDHHGTNPGFAVYNYVHTAASSVGEIVYQMIKMMGLDISVDIATCLYVAISTDTGGFRYSNTTPVTHRIAADLIDNGVNVADVSQRVFECMSLEKVKLMGSAIDRLELMFDGKVALMTVTQQMIDEAGAREEDCDGLVNIARSIRGVEVAALLKHAGKDEVRVNLRSNTDADVSAVASDFDGGGHKKAAGCTIRADINEARQNLLESIIKTLEN